MSFRCKFNFEVNGVDYFIERDGKADKKGNVKVDVKFYKIENGNEVPLNGEARRSTNDIIRDYVGTYEDFILTVLSIQNSKAGSFIDLGQTERKDLLCQFMGLTVFDQLYNLANDKFKETNTLLKNVSKEQLLQELQNVSGSIDINNSSITQYNLEVKELESKKDEQNNKLLELSNNVVKTSSFDIDITELESEKKDLESKVSNFEKDINDKKTKFLSIESELNNLSSSLKSCDNIETDYEQYKICKDEESKKSSEIDKLKVVVKNKIDKLKKLEEHKYDPNCTYCVNNVFVKDAIKTKEELELDKNKGKLLVEEYNIIKNRLDSFGDIETRYKECQSVNNNKVKLEKTKEVLSTAILRDENFKIKLQNTLKEVVQKIENFYKNKDIIENNIKLIAEINDVKSLIKDCEVQIKSLNNKLFNTSTEKGRLELQYKNTTDQLNKVKELEDSYESYKL